MLFGLMFCLLVFLAGTGASHAQVQKTPSVGVFVHVDLEEAIQQCKKEYKAQHNDKNPSKKEVQACISDLYVSLLSPPYISGIALGVHWDRIQLQSMKAFCQQYTCPSRNPCPPDIKCPPDAIIPIDVVVDNSDFFDWSYIVDAFDVTNGTAKQVLLKLTPGVESPKWLINPSTGQIASCDTPVFNGGNPDPYCGTQTFHHIPEQRRADSLTQPLPWNLIYQTAWANFLYQLKHAIAGRFPHNFLGVDLAGPNTASPEMILPTSGYHSYVVTATGKTDADDAWAMLIANTYKNTEPMLLGSDQAFINSWFTFIVTYQAIFQNATLVISPDDEAAMPEIGALSVHGDNFLYKKDGLCNAATSNFAVSCETKTEVLSNFLDYPFGIQSHPMPGANLKAAMIGGLVTASNPDNGDIGLPGVKLMAQKYGILGGAQFDHPISNPTFTQEEGCPPGKFCCPPGQVCKCPKSQPDCTFETLPLTGRCLAFLATSSMARSMVALRDYGVAPWASNACSISWSNTKTSSMR